MKSTCQEEAKNVKKTVVSLTSAILMIALITNIAGWIHHAEAHPSIIITINVTEYCVDTTTTRPQNDICSYREFVEVNESHFDPNQSRTT